MSRPDVRATAREWAEYLDSLNKAEAELCAAWGEDYDAERITATQNAESRVLVAAWEYARACQALGGDADRSFLFAGELLTLARRLVDE